MRALFDESKVVSEHIIFAQEEAKSAPQKKMILCFFGICKQAYCTLKANKPIEAKSAPRKKIILCFFGICKQSYCFTTCDMWQMTQDAWHLRHDMWHMTLFNICILNFVCPNWHKKVEQTLNT